MTSINDETSVVMNDENITASSNQGEFQSKVYIVHSLEKVSECLYHRIHHAFIQALDANPRSTPTHSNNDSTFTIAMSGGSIPNFLVHLPSYFTAVGIDPQWHKWHILLADERLVPYEDSDSNLRLIQDKLLDQLPMIPKDQIYGINYNLLSKYLLGKSIHEKNTDPPMSSIHDLARDYQERCLEPLWKQRILQHNQKQNNTELHPILLDCVLLGFGPDGHTCSLFPQHSLLQEDMKWVSALDDSPKLPLERITLTLPVLNQMSRDIIFVGVGSSKKRIVQEIFVSMETKKDDVDDLGERMIQINHLNMDNCWSTYLGKLVDLEHTPYPCAMIRPQGKHTSLSWILDDDAAASFLLL